MPPSILADAFGHHVWATIRVLDACASLDDAQLATAVPGTYGSIIDTLRHTVGADLYATSCAPAPEPFDEPASDIPTLRAVIQGHDLLWQDLIADDLDPTTDVVESRTTGTRPTRRSASVGPGDATGRTTAARSARRSPPSDGTAGDRHVGLRGAGRPPHLHPPADGSR
jgi:hypothetical protein